MRKNTKIDESVDSQFERLGTTNKMEECLILFKDAIKNDVSKN